VSIRDVRVSDAPRIAAIYNHYVRETIVTFEEAPVADAEMARRISETTVSYPWLVWDDGAAVLAYAYASSWKRRSAYRFAAESTIYAAPEATGRGIGSLLYPALLSRMRELGLHCAIGGISLPNPASIALHEKLGFVPIGRFREVGFKQDRWVDVGYWELALA
jgi:phosphinothricin acetyltransferase